ncbi:uncharacterized protein LOC110117666 [Ceratitis capitata]|uniref:uncharacterized protein LOC110117666 n=1 Tax=Ceratitis capitata TaxID=7213 RepID=UPI000A10EEE1|nr:uncharacterized protein LOC110117666 [Ceratitis capitata]
MAALPPERTELSRPFTNTGVDFTGPFDIKNYTGRACLITKGYVCVFVCFATKAIHPEATSDLSTSTFLAAFARFVARRGCPLHEETNWHFIPPGAPHVGGLWEAGVKSFKTHFRRVANAMRFTMEEFSTLLAKIEACLNSRPISPLSDNPESIEPLTHFLIGSPLLAIAEPEISGNPMTIINGWQKLKWQRVKWQFPHRRLTIS